MSRYQYWYIYAGHTNLAKDFHINHRMFLYLVLLKHAVNGDLTDSPMVGSWPELDVNESYRTKVTP